MKNNQKLHASASTSVLNSSSISVTTGEVAARELPEHRRGILRTYHLAPEPVSSSGNKEDLPTLETSAN